MASAKPVLTGYGVVTTHGSGVDAAWDALSRGAVAGNTVRLGAGVVDCFAATIPPDYRPHSSVPRNLAQVLDAGSLIAIDAAIQALEAAGLGAGAGDARRFAVADGFAYRAPGQGTLFAPYGQAVARALGVRGPVLEVGGAEASGAAAIAAGARLIEAGEADVVLAGAAQALQQPVVDHLVASGLASGSGARPFDESHAGCVPAEGAAYVVLESEDHARSRGLAPWAHLQGVAQLFDPTAEPLATSEAAEAGRSVQAALASAGFLQGQVDLIVSCADGRPAVDFSDGLGIRRTFGRHAHYAPVTTVAGALGQALAASAPLALAMAAEAMRRQQVFPIPGLQRPEQDLELPYARSLEAQRLEGVVVTCLGLGGTNVSMVLCSAKAAARA